MNEEQQRQYKIVGRMLNAGIDGEASLGSEALSEDYLRSAIEALRPLAPALEQEHFDQLFDDISKVLSIRINTGVMIEASDHRPWLAERRAEIDWRLWGAYSAWQINSGRPPIVVDSLDRSLDVILDHLGDPYDEGSWSRRGLVIGDVQSGKTGTYIGLIDKAADAGYRVFILLTGNTESLRQQTQSRVDQGVIGRDSMSTARASTERANKPKAVGIGKLLESTSSAMNMTTMTTDFRKNSTQAVDISPGPDNLVFFVTKKNKTVLDRIADWLEKQDNVGGKLHVPLLLIDDESDYASINTRNADESPTAINAGIRRLLKIFSRSAYVGFTATPFANIFIDDEKDDDLFPKDFIYGLEAPSNYVGPQSLFGADRDPAEDDPWRLLDDAEEHFPVRHKSGHLVDRLPESLLDALRTFMVSNAIRDLRGQEGDPRAMLINVSRYNNVQKQVFELVTTELAAYRNAIQLHSRNYASGMNNDTLRQMENTFIDEYSECGSSWSEVLATLPASVSEIQALLVNSKADRKLEQDELSATPPPRLIAIGGDLLSRGLTLDGLTVSYFHRHTTAADTLMQMGRWFGYREGYGDLCRLWIDEEMAAAYAHAADSLDELRLELKRMRNQNLTPEEYGLAVANHPGALLITARNKMRATKPGRKQISLRGRSIESYRLPALKSTIESNLTAAADLADDLSKEYGEPDTSKANRPMWRGVSKSYVADFLGKFRAHESFELFQEHALSRFVRNAAADDLQNWDVVFVEGNGPIRAVGTLSLSLPTRNVGAGADGAWLVSGRRQRVAGPGDVAAALSPEQVAAVRDVFLGDPENAGKRTVPDNEYVYALSRPVMLVYLLDPQTEGKPISTTMPFTAVVIAIPGVRDEEGNRVGHDDVTYILNRPAQRLWFPELTDTSLEDDDDV
jgi:hypothetical protein